MGRVAEAEPKPGEGGGAVQAPSPYQQALLTRSLRDHPPHEGEGEAWRARARVVAAARGWLGTPYRHQASVKGEGADCLGLVRGVWREVMGEEPEAPPPYRPDWAEVGGEEALWSAARRWLMEISPERAGLGDVLLFRMAAGAPAKHCAVLSAVEGPERRMIHAYWGRSVVESWMGPWWRRRLVAAFRWPEPLAGI
ncbi:peptidase P60 [Brevundimonas diminuta]|nr:peptidase P60 [Brevundimonas diminuta]